MTQTDNKLIIDSLSNLTMKPSELTEELLAQITNTTVIIKESYTNYHNKPAAPLHDTNGGNWLPQPPNGGMTQ